MTVMPSPSEVSKEEFCRAAENRMKRVVGKWLGRNPSFRKYGRDVLESAAWLAVLEAYDSYDPNKVMKASEDPVGNYVAYQIRFALLREINWMLGNNYGEGMSGKEDGAVWGRFDPVRKWANRFEQANHRRPTLDEAREAFPKLDRAGLRNVIIGPVERGDGWLLIADGGKSARQVAEEAGQLERVVRWMNKNLSAREREIYVKCKLEDMTFKEVGSLYGLTRQRVEQIVSRAHGRITAAFAPLKQT